MEDGCSSDVRSSIFVSEMNKMVDDSIPSSEELKAYYESRPELTEYTIQKELHRMAYTVFTHKGKKLTVLADIEAYQGIEYFRNQDGTTDNNDFFLEIRQPESPGGYHRGPHVSVGPHSAAPRSHHLCQ
jgi:hypothetical protein